MICSLFSKTILAFPKNGPPLQVMDEKVPNN
jgi:hypothetical protein